jgi:uncharacterized protein YecE (DUF72 family)
MDVYVGTSGYSYPEWKGRFYPPKTPARAMLGYYAARFGTVEINNTFYRAPTAELLAGWAAQVPAHFRFVLKAPQPITHVSKLAGCQAAVESLFAAAAVLGERLGPVLFQLPPHTKKDVPLLRDFLASLPPTATVAFEFRHASWFCDDVFAALRERDAALCVADAGDELEVPFVATGSRGYIRLRRADYTDATLREWVARIRAQAWRECVVFFKHEDAATGPRFAARLVELLNEAGEARAA